MEWLPGNKEYDLAGKYNIEWYSADGREASDEGALISYIRGRLLFKPTPSTKAPCPSKNRLL